jgi:hypothetical protein
MEAAAHSSEKLVKFYNTIWHYISEDSNLHPKKIVEQ